MMCGVWCVVCSVWCVVCACACAAAAVCVCGGVGGRVVDEARTTPSCTSASGRSRPSASSPSRPPPHTARPCRSRSHGPLRGTRSTPLPRGRTWWPCRSTGSASSRAGGRCHHTLRLGLRRLADRRTCCSSRPPPHRESSCCSRGGTRGHRRRTGQTWRRRLVAVAAAAQWH